MGTQGEIRAIDAAFRSDFEAAYAQFGNRGRRVLGFCYRDLTVEADVSTFTEDSAFVTENAMIFVGVAAIMDPPKDGVKAAIAKCHSANIKVFMVTGDHPLTAAAIARQVRRGSDV